MYNATFLHHDNLAMGRNLFCSAGFSYPLACHIAILPNAKPPNPTRSPSFLRFFIIKMYTSFIALRFWLWPAAMATQTVSQDVHNQAQSESHLMGSSDIYLGLCFSANTTIDCYQEI